MEDRRDETENGRIKRQLCELKDLEFQRFASSLIPNIPKERVIGVRLPMLRKIAKDLARGDWKGYLRDASSDSLRKLCFRVW